MSVQFGTNVNVQKKRVKFYNRESSAVTIYEGMPVCYIYDTTANILGYDKGTGGDPKSQSTPNTTAEGYQNEGKFLIVETVNDDNALWWAGVTTSAKNGKSVAAESYEWIEIYEPNGAIVPVRTDLNCTGPCLWLQMVLVLLLLRKKLLIGQVRLVWFLRDFVRVSLFIKTLMVLH